MLNAKSILSLSIFIIFKLIYTVSTFSRTRHSLFYGFSVYLPNIGKHSIYIAKNIKIISQQPIT